MNDIEKLQTFGFSQYHLMFAVNKFDNDQALVLLKDYLKGFSLDPKLLIDNYSRKKRGYNLFVWSEQNGTGKTTLLHKLAIFFWNKRFDLKYQQPFMLFGQVSELFKKAKDYIFSDAEIDIFSVMQECQILFIDDIDKAGKLTEFEMENLRLVINYRYANIKPILFTSNSSLDQLLSKGVIDPAIYSRLNETCHIIQLKGKDNRFDNKEVKGMEKYYA